jgi:hypothetical protein
MYFESAAWFRRRKKCKRAEKRTLGRRFDEGDRTGPYIVDLSVAILMWPRTVMLHLLLSLAFLQTPPITFQIVFMAQFELWPEVKQHYGKGKERRRGAAHPEREEGKWERERETKGLDASAWRR